MRRIAAVTMTVAATALAAVGCGGGDDGSGGGGGGGEPLKIGAMNPYSGDLALYGNELLRGYQLAVDEVNAKGGVDGRQVELFKGDAGAADQAITQAQRLATQEQVDLFTGTYVSAVAQSASEVAAQQNKVYWESNALAENLTMRGMPGFLRFGPSAADFATVSVEAMAPVAETIGRDPRGLKVYVEHEDSIYGTSVSEQQIKLLEEAGAEVVGNGAHDAAAADLTDSVLRAKSANPDVWLITGYVPDVNLLLRTANQQGFDPGATVTVGTGDTNETLEAVGERQVEGVFVVSYPRPDISEDYGPGSDAFLQAYRDEFGGEPRAPQTLNAYSSMQVLLRVLGDAGSTEPEAVREAALALDEPENSLPSGYGLQFDDNGQNQRSAPVVIQWQGGKQVTVFPEQAAGSNEIKRP